MGKDVVGAKITRMLLQGRTAYEKDQIYRYLWKEHVVEDIRARIKDTGVELTEDQIDYAAERYVYDGKYDCNQSYWENIDAVVELARQ